jgi:DNA-3-methyladenine glycosylase II
MAPVALVRRKSANHVKRSNAQTQPSLRGAKNRAGGKTLKAAPAIARAVKAGLPRLIENDDDVRAGVRALRRKCDTMRLVHDVAGHPPLRRRPAGFEGMARIVVGQQLSVASAEAIWGRTAAACRPFEPATLLAANDATLLGAGLSRGKVRTLRALATACLDGLDLDRLAHASEEDVHTALTNIVGIGPWTADVYIMFCLGRADGWASGDLALQIAAQHALKLRERPDPVVLQEIAERWRPWRGVAARLLWAYYAVLKQKRTAVPV